MSKPVALIVEDRPEVAAIWKRYLTPLEFDIKHALTLREASFMSREIPPPQLILLDLRLEDSDSYNTLSAIKMLTAPNPDCTVIVVSGLLNPELIQFAIEQGAASTIEKLSINRARDLWVEIDKAIASGSETTRKALAQNSQLISQLIAQLP